MKDKRRISLFLGLACFIGILIIFGVNGFLGVYDTIYVTAGEYEQTICPESFKYNQEDSHVEVECGEIIHFRYELNNRRFSSYSAPVQASVWIGKQKVADLFSRDIRIKPFGKVMLEWDFDIVEQLGPESIVGTYTVKVKRGEVERNVIVEVSSPVIARHIELEVDEQTSYLEVESIIRSFPWVTEVRLEGSYTGVDLYTGKQIPEGKKVLRITIVYQSFSHALTYEEVGIIQEQMLAALYQELGASLQS